MSEDLTIKPNNIEEIRKSLAEKVKLNLKKYESQITNFNFGTVTAVKGEWYHLNNLEPLKYDKRYKQHFKTYNFDESLGKIKGNGYIYANLTHWITFESYLGGDFRAGEYRNGNKFVITIAFDKNGDMKNETEVIDSIKKLLDTITPFEITKKQTLKELESTKQEAVKNIAKEGLPVLHAFKEIGQKYENGKNIRMQDIIKEYEKALINDK
jgi:hypothetical protein